MASPLATHLAPALLALLSGSGSNKICSATKSDLNGKDNGQFRSHEIQKLSWSFVSKRALNDAVMDQGSFWNIVFIERRCPVLEPFYRRVSYKGRPFKDICDVTTMFGVLMETNTKVS